MEDVNRILKCLRGEDAETESKVGFGALVRRLRLQNNDELGWAMIIKSLIIIDRYRSLELRCVS